MPMTKKFQAVPGQIQVSADGKTVWLHAMDGSTVGRFSKTFGMDIHTTITQQLAGAGQCLHCTHAPPGKEEWLQFCDLMGSTLASRSIRA